MTSDQLLGILRAFIPGAVALATYFGLGDNATDTIVATAFATAIVGAWSAYANSPASKIAAINRADNGVKVVADTSPSPVVNGPLK